MPTLIAWLGNRRGSVERRMDRWKNGKQEVGQMPARVYFLVTALALLFCAVLTAALLTGVRHSDLTEENKAVSLTNGWMDGNGLPISMPLFLEWSDGARHSYRVILPERDSGLRAPSLFFASRYLNARFYLDGVPLGECLAKPVGTDNSQGKMFALLSLPDDYGGKELRMDVELLLGENVNYEIPVPTINSRAGVLSAFLKGDLYGVLVDIFIFCISLILFLFGQMKGPLRRNGMFLFNGMFAAAFALYSLCTSDMVHLFCNNAYLIYLFEFLLLALLPIPLVLSFAQQCHAPYRRILQGDALVLIGNLFVQALLHFCTPLEVRNTVFLTHAAMLISLLLMVSALIWGWSGDSRKWTVLTFTPIFAGTAADIALFYFSDSYRSSFWIKIGVLFFVILQTCRLIRNYLTYCENDLKNSVYRRMAYVDALTGLGNRAAFEERIAELEQLLPEFTSLWCVCADINDLKKVNDSAGHAAGDRLIQGTAQVLRSVMCGACTVYRTGGDEFVMFITDQPEKVVVEGRWRLARVLEDYNRSHGEIKLSIAVGCDSFRFGESDTVSELVSRADTRMYEDKRIWKQHCCPTDDNAGKIR